MAWLLIAAGAVLEGFLLQPSRRLRIAQRICFSAILTAIFIFILALVLFVSNSSWDSTLFLEMWSLLFFIIFATLFYSDFRQYVLPTIHKGNLLIITLVLDYAIISNPSTTAAWPVLILPNAMVLLNAFLKHTPSQLACAATYGWFLLMTAYLLAYLAPEQFAPVPKERVLNPYETVTVGMSGLYLFILCLQLLMLFPFKGDSQSSEERLRNLKQDLAMLSEKYAHGVQVSSLQAMLVFGTIFVMAANYFYSILQPATLVSLIVIGCSLWKPEIRSTDLLPPKVRGTPRD